MIMHEQAEERERASDQKNQRLEEMIRELRQLQSTSVDERNAVLYSHIFS